MIRLLLVDDHKMMRQALHMALMEEPDIEIVGEADDGATAIRQSSILLPTVIIMDVAMPGIDGIEATRRIVFEHPGIRVLAFSMDDDPCSVARMLAAGAAGFVAKGCECDDLLLGIRTVAAGNPYFCREMAGTPAPLDMRSHSGLRIHPNVC